VSVDEGCKGKIYRRHRCQIRLLAALSNRRANTLLCINEHCRVFIHFDKRKPVVPAVHCCGSNEYPT
jgi:hypothetical protein